MIPHDVNLSRIRDDNLRIRLERAQSWIDLAQSHKNSAHARFIFYWIAFNAMYGQKPLRDRENTRRQNVEIRVFLEIVKKKCDSSQNTTETLRTMEHDLKALVEDEFLSKQYWEDPVDRREVKRQCREGWKAIRNNIARDPFDCVFRIACRLLVLRNRIFHGSARGNDQSQGFPSLEIGLRVIEKLVRHFFDLLEDTNPSNWPDVPYPGKGRRGHPHQY